MSRPLKLEGIGALEAAFQARQSDQVFLQQLMDELSLRATKRAADLQATVRRSLLASISSGHAADPVRKRAANQGAAAPANKPDGILSAWVALEVLSPPSYRKPEDLAGGNRQAVARLGAARLPWAGSGEKSKPGLQLYYQLVLGSIELDPALQQLLALYSDKRVERPKSRGEAALAVVMLDRTGRPVEGAATVASFGWGLAQALGGDLQSLAGWREAEAALTEQLQKRLLHTDEEGGPLPLDHDTIEACHEWLVSALGLPPTLVKPPSFAIRSYKPYKSAELPQGLLLNSFYLGDLCAARRLFLLQGAGPELLRRYLGVLPPQGRKDLLNDKAALSDAVSPARFPAGRWPGPGRHPLVLLQQAAVNLAVDASKPSGILAVNGPPGTGKTTLLRDVVAALVTERARAMAKLDNPADAFVHTGEKLPAGSAWLHLYKVAPDLRGFEMVVASTNNKAVENVSAELPGLGSVTGDAPRLRYLKTVSDALQPEASWGLIAAVLGNAGNRSRFRQAFWWDDDRGLRRYLAWAAGSPSMIQEADPVTGEVRSRPPLSIEAEHAPSNHDEALLRWKVARKAFQERLRRSDDLLGKMEAIRQAVERLPALNDAVLAADAEVRKASSAAHQAALDQAEAERALAIGKQQSDAASADLDRVRQGRPGFWARMFRTAKASAWVVAERNAQDRAQRLTEAFVMLQADADAARLEASRVQAFEKATLNKQRISAAAAQETAALIRDAKALVGNGMVDGEHFTRSHRDQQMVAPWLNDAMQRCRDDVFVAAVALHKAFLDAAAKPLRHNLGALMQVFGGQAMPDSAKQALLPHLWASLFLVVPVVSTTFASVERMFGSLPSGSLGWLLVDEAGQATPQAATGALMRTQRAIVVGDPLQIEPVVTLPDTLTQAICRSFGADPDRFNAPVASVQTLADAATPYMAEFPSRDGSRTVGVPLLVHRRCAEPMFGISNAVAYEGLMVQSKVRKPSAIRDVLGPSTWFDIQGSSEEKWCPQEGAAVVSMLRRLVGEGVPLDLYIVTPFVAVQDRLRSLIQSERVLPLDVTEPDAWLRGHIGTVHTVQGREAEAVIFVLGAPDFEQAGARGWAGGTPNLLNVAATRAKEALYVVGNRRLWKEAGVFRMLDLQLAGKP